jgi:hypothetical protein
MTEQRRLAAILVADVVGYSKRIGSDEAGTLAPAPSDDEGDKIARLDQRRGDGDVVGDAGDATRCRLRARVLEVGSSMRRPVA